ncbi:hypothetical protein CROQUDRAFT_94108 [Cronartium quercuum f. sp. fusiforme G11]|uniref:Uncharacterized protein n=1 Tax=Cronartium quercuum f. sp. fusiforme G11 TaxID=708437 RepID=A0A9P6TAI3_9BASI|nr:hypothetical protein CROQUDRAFT_94108 [Cronartium quercuum f. sp. fusiforme G11]
MGGFLSNRPSQIVDRREAGLSTGLLLVESPAIDQLSMVLVDRRELINSWAFGERSTE